jgi:hypothetical protein
MIGIRNESLRRLAKGTCDNMRPALRRQFGPSVIQKLLDNIAVGLGHANWWRDAVAIAALDVMITDDLIASISESTASTADGSDSAR